MRKFLFALIFTSFGVLVAQNPTAVAPPSAILPDGVRLPVELINTLDAKKAKAGDVAKMELLAALLNSSKEVVIPKGAKLTGKVLEAVAHTKENPDSRLRILVEKADWNGGSMPLHMFIESPIKPRSGAEGPAGGGRGRDRVEEGNFSHPQAADVTLGPLTSSWDDVVIITAEGKPLLTCKRHNVTLGSGTRFFLKQIND